MIEAGVVRDPCNGVGEYERKSLLRGSSRGSEIWRELWLGARNCDILYRQPLDCLGHHTWHFGLAVCNLLRTVSFIDGSWRPGNLSRAIDNADRDWLLACEQLHIRTPEVALRSLRDFLVKVNRADAAVALLLTFELTGALRAEWVGCRIDSR